MDDMYSREYSVKDGRAAFYACCLQDIKQSAANCGWAIGVHGTLAHDMDLMAMPWTEWATSADEMIKNIEALFEYSEVIPTQKDTTSKPNGRVVYIINIFADFYLDINVIERL